MVEGAAGEPDLRGEIVHRRGGKTRCRERFSRCSDQLGAVFLHRFGATLRRHGNLLIRIRCVCGVDGQAYRCFTYGAYFIALACLECPAKPAGRVRFQYEGMTK